MKGKRYTTLCYVYAVGWTIMGALWLLMYFGVITGSMTGKSLTGLLGLVYAIFAVIWLVRAIKRTKNPPEEE